MQPKACRQLSRWAAQLTEGDRPVAGRDSSNPRQTPRVAESRHSRTQQWTSDSSKALQRERMSGRKIGSSENVPRHAAQLSKAFHLALRKQIE
jgi:hypothetical protein